MGVGGGRGAKSSTKRKPSPPSIIQYSLVFSLHTVAYYCAYIDQPPFKKGRTNTTCLIRSVPLFGSLCEMLYFFTLATNFLFWKCTECCGPLSPRKFYAKQIHINVKKSWKSKDFVKEYLWWKPGHCETTLTYTTSQKLSRSGLSWPVPTSKHVNSCQEMGEGDFFRTFFLTSEAVLVSFPELFLEFSPRKLRCHFHFLYLPPCFCIASPSFLRMITIY